MGTNCTPKHSRFTSVTDSTLAAPDVIRGETGGVAFERPGVAGGDRIDLSAIDANTLASGNQAFKLGGVSTGSLSLTDSGTDTILEAYNDGDAAADFRLIIEDGQTLASAYTASDFIL